MAEIPESVVDVVTGGDTLLVLSGIAGANQKIALRVSSHVLRMTSTVFSELLAVHSSDNALTLLAADGDAMFLLCNILHLRNDALPPRLPPELLYKFAMLVEKYKCAVAVGRATLQWFDKLYNSQTPCDTFKVVQAAYLLDEPTYFARFTERWVLSERIDSCINLQGLDEAMRKLAGKSQYRLSQIPHHTDKLSVVDLSNARKSFVAAIRAEIDLMVDPCSLVFQPSAEHHIDWPAHLEPDEDEDGNTPGLCWVDRQAAIDFLGELRQQHIWPSTVWPVTLGALVNAIKTFNVPKYDDADKCEFCEDCKGKFALSVSVVKSLYINRLWGMCLDCFKAGGFDAGECRFEHSKPRLRSLGGSAG